MNRDELGKIGENLCPSPAQVDLRVYSAEVTDLQPDQAPRPLKKLLSLLTAARVLLLLVIVTFVGAIVIAKPWTLLFPPEHVIVEKKTPSLLVAIRNVSRLETAEVHVEKVVDLTDKQSSFFGLVESKDALLLVAVGHATVGVDLSKLRDNDVSFDPVTRVARINLPEPEVLSATLDEESTYVFSRSTDLLARRNEQLESNARRQAVKAIQAAAEEPDIMKRARDNADKQLSALAKALGANHVDVTFQTGIR